MAALEKSNFLTQRQREVYEFLKDRIQNRGYGPTVREIGEYFDIKSPNGVMCHLKALEKKGLIHRKANMSRAICLAEPSHGRLSLPFIGPTVSIGPIPSDEHVEFERMFAGDDKACIHVEGKAFESLSINNGDYIIVRRGVHGAEGSLIAALDDCQDVMLYRRHGKGKKLAPAISGASLAQARQVLGTVVGVVRQFDEVTSGVAVNSVRTVAQAEVV